MSRWDQVRGLALGALALLSVVTGPAARVSAAEAMQAAREFSVEGRILNGTAGAEPPTGIDLKVIAFGENEIRGTYETEIDTDGRFRAASVPRLEGVTYVLGAEYQGVPYLAAVVVPEAGLTVTQDLTVYESSATDPGIRFDQSALIVTEADEGRRSVTMTELHTITNPTDRTFAPQVGGPGGSAGLLVFGLPQGSYDLTPGRGLDSSQMVEIGLGFASLSPIYPGRREVSFSYRIPYTGPQVTFNRTIRYPVDMVRVLVRTPGPEVRSASLSPMDPATIGGQQYRILGGGPLAPGAALSFTLEGLPLPGGVFATIPPAVPAVAGAIVGLILLVIYWRRTRLQPVETGAAPSVADATVEALVDLEIERSEGRLSDEEYHRARTRLLAEHLTRPAEGMPRMHEPREASN